MTTVAPMRFLLVALVGMLTMQPGQPRATTDTPTTTTALGDDRLTLYPQRNREIDDFVVGESGDAGSGDTGTVDELAGTGFEGVTWGSTALAVAALGAIITVSARPRRPRRPRGGARSGPSA